MKETGRTLAIASGYTFFALIWVASPLIDPAHLAIYHWSQSPGPLFLGPVIDLLAGILAVTLVLLSARRPGRWRVVVWSFLLCILPWLALKCWSFSTSRSAPRALNYVLLLGGPLLFALLQIAWRPAWQPRFERVVRPAGVCLTFASFPLLIAAVQLCYFGFQARHLNPQTEFHRPASTQSASAAQSRIIWIIFDELSEAQVYEHRFPGLQLPAFDALAQQSTVFRNVSPAGTKTENVVPTFLTGVRIDSIRASAAGLPLLHRAAEKSWAPFSAEASIFADARHLGYRTGVAGWYNPYCRMLAGVLNDCFWVNRFPVADGLFADASAPGNALLLAQFASGTGHFQPLLSRLLHLAPRQKHEADLRVMDLRDLRQATDALLRNPNLGFAMIHLPIPHPPAFYDRATGQFVTNGRASYIDNLALADRTLAKLRQELESTGQWDTSTIVLMGDHGWREAEWRKRPGWHPEDIRAALGGAADIRPAYVVKLAGQHAGLQIDSPYTAVATHDLLEALLTRAIRTPADLVSFAAHHSASR